MEVVEARAVVKEEGGGGDCTKKSRHTGWLGAVQINASQPARQPGNRPNPSESTAL